MRKPPKILNDEARIASLTKMNLLSTSREADLDKITRIAQLNFKTEIAVISLIDGDRQWFKSRRGVDVLETARDISICGHAIQQDDVFVVSDARSDDRFHDNPLVTGAPWIRFYAGKPLTNQEGFKIGTLCVISSEPRCFDEDEIVTLADLGRMVEVVLENRKLSETQQALLESLVEAQRDKMLDSLTGLWNRRGLDELFEREIARAVREKRPFAVGLVDIDHFKKFNDRFGHAIGDEVIKLTADLLVHTLRSTDVVARYGGEEFVFLSPNVEPDRLSALGEKIVNAFRSRASVETEFGRQGVTASIGLVGAAPGRVDEGLASRLISCADQAMYRAKTAGRNRFEIYDATEEAVIP